MRRRHLRRARGAAVPDPAARRTAKVARRTQFPALAVQLRDGADAPSLEDLQAHAREHIAGYKVPRQVTVVDAVHRTAVGKVVITP